MTYTETDIVATIETLAGDGIAGLSQLQLDAIDQFHAGGPEAIERLLPGLGLTAGMSVLDVGSGLGGPARQVARSTGARVVGVDITRSYVEAAIALTRIAGLTGSVDYICADISRIERSDFDAAYVTHVQMNVADKETFFSDIADKLRTGARLAVFEVCRTGDADPALPLPWSIDGTDSFLATGPGLLGSITDAGFEVIEWVDETTWITGWFEEMGARMGEGGTAATLPALLTDGLVRMINFAAALSNGVLSVRRGTFVLGR